MSDDRPSIAELQRRMRPSDIADAVPVLLEIAAAALAAEGAHCTGPVCKHYSETHYAPCELVMLPGALDAALAKVRP